MRFHHRPLQDRRPDTGDVQTASWHPERLLEQCGGLGRVFRENGQRRGRNPRLNQRGNPLGCPRDVLKYSDGKPSDLDFNHGRVMYHGV